MTHVSMVFYSIFRQMPRYWVATYDGRLSTHSCLINTDGHIPILFNAVHVVPAVQWLMVTFKGWYRTRHPMHCDHFMIFLSPLTFVSFLIHPPEVCGKYQHIPLVANQEKLVRNDGEFCRRNIAFILSRVL
jgi:hypothetical protein